MSKRTIICLCGGKMHHSDDMENPFAGTDDLRPFYQCEKCGEIVNAEPPHSEHRGWDSLLDDIGAALSDDDCALRPCDVCSGQHTGPGQTCPACRAPAGPPDLGDVLRRAESAIEDLPADEFEAFCAAHPGLWAALVAESAIEDLPADESEAFCAAHPGLRAALVKAAAGRG